MAGNREAGSVAGADAYRFPLHAARSSIPLSLFPFPRPPYITLARSQKG